jgi:tungstate transport system ATP-binding protein
VTGPVLEARGIEVRRASGFALRVPALAVREGEVLAVIGPNGSGKSTLLRVLALLEAPGRGEILFRGRPVHPGSTESLRVRRRMGVVFQEPLLSDTTVAGNVALGLRLRGVRSRATRVEEWLDRLGIRALASRQAVTLSGGEAQRTSLARAFVLDPEVLFLDEPLAALDPPTRDALLADLRRILGETRATAVLVTHDRNEALALGDRVAVLMDGQIRQLDTPDQVFGFPVDEDVARLVGVETILAGTVLHAAEGLSVVEAGGVRIEAAGEFAPGAPVLACIRPEDVVLSRADQASSARNRLAGRVVAVDPLGFSVRIRVDCGIPLVALVTRHSLRELELEVGTRVNAAFKATAVHLLARR